MVLCYQWSDDKFGWLWYFVSMVKWYHVGLLIPYSWFESRWKRKIFFNNWINDFFDKLFEREAYLSFWKNNLWFILVVEVLAKCAKTLMNFPGHDNIYVHCFIRRTSLFCGSFEEQPRRIIPKRFRLTLNFSACRILAWRTIPEAFINEVRWLLRSQHDSMSSTHQIKLLIYTVLRLLWNLNMWPIRLSARTQDSQSWKSSSILLWATIIYCGVEQW